MKRTFALAAASTVALLGCDAGTTVTSGTTLFNQCVVRAESNDDGFSVEIVYLCAGDDHTQCYEIIGLDCGEEPQSISAPLRVESCPGDARYCVNDCIANETGGAIWDTPELLAIPACNTYEQ